MIGDQQDIFNRLKSNLPPWFGNNPTPILDAILQGYATATEFNYAQYTYDKLQTRIQTATDNNLDLISKDYLGDQLPRKKGQSDEVYRKRILSFLLLERGTRKGLYEAILFLTGIPPILFEPWDGSFCGYYNVPQTLAYNTWGCYGSGLSSSAYQGWIDVFVPQEQGNSPFSGYNSSSGGFNASAGRLYYGQPQSPFISDLDILILIAAFKAFGTLIHVRIHHGNYIRFYDV